MEKSHVIISINLHNRDGGSDGKVPEHLEVEVEVEVVEEEEKILRRRSGCGGFGNRMS